MAIYACNSCLGKQVGTLLLYGRDDSNNNWRQLGSGRLAIALGLLWPGYVAHTVSGSMAECPLCVCLCVSKCVSWGAPRCTRIRLARLLVRACSLACVWVWTGVVCTWDLCVARLMALGIRTCPLAASGVALSVLSSCRGHEGGRRPGHRSPGGRGRCGA